MPSSRRSRKGCPAAEAGDLIGQTNFAHLDQNPTDYQPVGMGVVQHAPAGTEQIPDQIAVAKLGVGGASHHVRMGAVIGAIEHGCSEEEGGGAH